MKRIVLTLCVFIALVTVADAARFYKCVDSSGNVILTDNLPPDAKCEFLGAERDKTPEEREMERQQIESERAIRAEQNANEQRREAELLRQRQQLNRAQEEAQRQNDRQQAQQQKQEHEQKQQKDKEELNCYSFHPPGSPYTWEHCRDKNGKLVSKKRI